MNYNLKSFLPIGLSFFILMASCRKESVQQQDALPVNSTASALTGSDSILKALHINDVIGEYSTRGSQTLYDGQANAQGSNAILSLDFYLVKKILPSPDKKHLTCPYSYGKYTSRGWKYIIGFDFKKGKITLQPNDAMAAEIVPGSFETLYADYNAAYNSFTFQTRFTALEDNGNEREVIEPLVKN